MTARILLVEDTEPIRYLQATWLRRAGYEVIEAATGAEGLGHVGDDIDVVVLDVHLPDMSGFDVCTAIKASPVTASLPVMHVSATAMDARSRTEGLERGADAYLTEPVDRSEFLAVVASLSRSGAARRATERVADRLARLADATLPLNAADTLTTLIEAAAQGAADVFGLPSIAVAETDSGLVSRALCAGRGRPVLTDPVGGPFIWVGQARPSYLEVADLPPAWAPLSERAGVPIARWFVCPVRHGTGQVTGGLGICLPGPDDVLSPDEERLVGQLAQAVAVALTNLRAYTQEHQTALTLQRALLPDRLPVVAGLEFAARYSPSSDVVSVGGDFYDAFVLPSGRVAVVIGDIQGHSLQAATVMAEMRFSLRAYVLEGHPPAIVVGLLNRLLLDHHPDHTTTLVLLLIDPVAHTVEIANAGHLPPLLLSGTDARYVEGDGVLLGVPSAAPTTVTVPFPAGGTFVLTTDGLIERRGENLELALARLAGAVVGAGSVGPEELADQLLIEFDAAAAEDDVALVVVRRTWPSP